MGHWFSTISIFKKILLFHLLTLDIFQKCSQIKYSSSKSVLNNEQTKALLMNTLGNIWLFIYSGWRISNTELKCKRRKCHLEPESEKVELNFRNDGWIFHWNDSRSSRVFRRSNFVCLNHHHYNLPFNEIYGPLNRSCESVDRNKCTHINYSAKHKKNVFFCVLSFCRNKAEKTKSVYRKCRFFQFQRINRSLVMFSFIVQFVFFLVLRKNFKGTFTTITSSFLLFQTMCTLRINEKKRIKNLFGQLF